MASEVIFDISHPMAILNGMLAKTEVIATIAYAETAPVVLELEKKLIPYDMLEDIYFAHKGEDNQNMRNLISGREKLGIGFGEEPFHMEDTLFFTQNPANPLEALTGTATGMDYPSLWHRELPPSGHFTKGTATIEYISRPSAGIGFSTFIESIRVNTDKLVQP